MSSTQKVAIIGSGLIGRSWAIIFSSFGYQVNLYDTNTECLARAPEIIGKEVEELYRTKLVRGDLTLEERLALIKTFTSLEECLKGVVHVQECVFEDLTLKQKVFKEIDQLLEPGNIHASICSSTSFTLPSLLFAQVEKHLDQCLVAHPINPPLHVRLVELVPHKGTREDIMIRTRITMSEIGQKPVVLNKEVSGFALNRIQAAVFQEAFRLVHDGIMTPEDVDTVVSDGLGPRYAFMGPWMTAHLNAVGVADYLERYGEGLYKVSKNCQPLLIMEGEAAQQIVDSMIREVPLDKLADARAWRDRCLIDLARVRDNLGGINK